MTGRSRRLRRARAFALATAIVSSALSATAATASSPLRPTWQHVSSTLTVSLDPRSPNPCDSGRPSCIELVLAEMERREAPLAAACDHRALFAELYRQLTAGLQQAADAGRFRNAPALRHFDAWFARYYFRAADAWRAHRLGDVPGAWRVAFTAAATRSVTGLGDLLLGMNAHITHDLPYVVAALVPKPVTTVDPDYAEITQLVVGSSVPLLEEIGARYDPTLRTAEVPLSLGGKLTFGQLIALWRTESWARGIALRDASTVERPTIEAQIDADATARAAAITAATAYVPFVQSSKARDAYCRAHR